MDTNSTGAAKAPTPTSIEHISSAFMHRSPLVYRGASLRLEAKRCCNGAWIVIEGFTGDGELVLDLSLDQVAIAYLAPLFAEALPDALAALDEEAA